MTEFNMKLSKRRLSKFRKTKESWKRWVRNPKENHFFFFCNTHISELKTKNDGVGDYTSPPKSPICDYPGCTQKCTQELFPNLTITLKIADEDIKFNRLYTLDKKGNFRKVKNYGKRVRSKRLSKKRNKST